MKDGECGEATDLMAGMHGGGTWDESPSSVLTKVRTYAIHLDVVDPVGGSARRPAPCYHGPRMRPRTFARDYQHLFLRFNINISPLLNGLKQRHY